MQPSSRFASCALAAVGFTAGLMPALAALLLGAVNAMQAAGGAAIVALPFAIWRGWFAGERGGGDAR